jgi:pimeloyl-ACP methyl ester carboxylesterase
MHQEYITLNDRKFFYRMNGEGPVVVLIHGFGEDGSIWSNQFAAFPGYRLVIPDLPGSGGSEMTGDMSMEGLARSVEDLLHYLDIGRSVVIGHSMGGYVALAYGEKFSTSLNGLGLFHSTAYPDSEDKKQMRKKGIGFIEEHGAFEFLKTSIPGLYSQITKSEHVQITEEQIAASHNFSDAALVSYYMSMMKRPDRKHVLSMLHVPILFILGKYDTAVPLEDGLSLCYLPELSYIHILGRSGHMGMREEPEAANLILLNYLNSIHHQTR